MPKKLRLGVVYDFRNPPESGMRTQDLYAAIMDQVTWLDGLGLDLVWFTEHHFVDDGYLPSWIPVAAAMAGRTSHVRFSCDVCLLPFNHPIRLAEDLAVLDNLSNGRVEIGAGMGYAPHEFSGFGYPVSRRVSLTDEGLEVLHPRLHRREIQLHTASATSSKTSRSPRATYSQAARRYGSPRWPPPGPPRAARFDTNLLPQGPRAGGLDPWRETLTASGRNPADYRVGIINSCLVTDDRERDWPAVRDGERRRMAVYSRFREAAEAAMAASPASPRKPASRRPGWSAMSRSASRSSPPSSANTGLTDLVTWGVPPGMRPDQMDHSLERFARDVAPRLRAMFPG